jgi:predicted dinucleotide-utilizing enzyme
MNYRLYRRITVIVILMSFLRTFPVYGEPPITQTPNSSENGTRLYSDSEIDLLIEDLSGAAKEAIEAAAAEAAKAASLASLEREASLVQAQALAIRESSLLQEENGALRKSRVKTAVITGVICFFSGLTIGAGGMAILQGVR